MGTGFELRTSTKRERTLVSALVSVSAHVTRSLYIESLLVSLDDVNPWMLLVSLDDVFGGVFLVVYSLRSCPRDARYYPGLPPSMSTLHNV